MSRVRVLLVLLLASMAGASMPDFFGNGGPDWSGIGEIAGLVFVLVVYGAVFDWLSDDK